MATTFFRVSLIGTFRLPFFGGMGDRNHFVKILLISPLFIIAVMKSGEITKIYGKWFLSPIPPKNGNLNVPMSDALKKVIANPTDSGDPATYR